MNRPTHWCVALLFAASTFLSACGGGSASSGGAQSSAAIASAQAGTSLGQGAATAGQSSYTISGSIFGITGVTVNLTGGATATTTDSTGNFAFSALGSGSYAVTPSKPGYVFTPVSRAAILGSDSLANLTFTATASEVPAYNISGTVSGKVGSGVEITLNGSNVGSVVTDSNGSYTFPGVSSGTYTVTAMRAGYFFGPPLIVNVSNANSTSNNFTSELGAGTLVFTAMRTLPPATASSAYSSTLVQSIIGGTPPYRYSAGILTSGAPPIGMYVDPNGNLTGTPGVPGQYDFTVCAMDSAGDVSACEPTSIMVVASSSAQPGPSVVLTADPATITAGQSSVLSWSSENATSCVPSGDWSVNESTSGSATVTPAATASYSLQCTGATGAYNASVLVTVLTGDSAPTVNLTASSTDITPGSSAILSWTSTNATSCTASGGWSGTQATSGAFAVTPAKSTLYVLTCSNPGGTAQSQAVIGVNGTAPPPQPTIDLSADPFIITAGGSSTLSWTTANATSCTASGGWTGSVALNASTTVTPTATTIYTLTCSGPGGTAQASLGVTVQSPDNVPTVSLTASSTQIASGGSSTLSWTSTNAASCTASGGWSGARAINGTYTVSPTTSTLYVIACAGPSGTAQSEVVIGVGGTGTSPQPTINLSANPNDIIVGDSSTLSWTTANATSCTGSGGWTSAQALNGSATVTPATTTTYTMTCSGPGGTAQASVTVTTSTAPAGTSWVYYGGQFDWPGDYSFDAVPDYTDTSGGPISGNYDIKITLSGAWGGWLPYAQNWNFNSAGYTKLTFALKPTVANQQWTVYFVKVGDIPVGIYLNVLDYGPAPVVGQWNTYTVPLADLGVLGQSIYKFCIQDQTGLSSNTWYVDNVGFAP